MSETTPFFSVVIPSCNVAKYLPKTVSAMQEQTFGDFEVLFMVEESQDNTLELARAAAAGDSRFQALALPLSGSASVSRNWGINHGRGKYIVFIDGDDWIEPQTLEDFHRKLTERGEVDLLIYAGKEYFEEDSGERRFNTATINISEKEYATIPPSPAGNISGCDVLAKMCDLKRNPIISVCLTAYRRDFLAEHQLYQIPGLRHQDNEWSPRVWFFAQSTAVLDGQYYIYRKRQGSVTTKVLPKSIYHMATVLNSLFDFCFSHDVPEKVKRTWASHWLSLLFWYFFNPLYRDKFPQSDRKAAFKQFFQHQGARRYIKMASYASLPKRLATPGILLFGLCGIDRVANLYFRCVYFPLINRRNKK